MKVCKNKLCEQQNPQSLSNFCKNLSKKDKLSIYCKECSHKYQKKWRSYNPDYDKNKSRIYYRENPLNHLKRSLKHKYGITIEQRLNMFHKQKGRCAVKNCNAELTLEKGAKNIAHVDHNHKTGKIRNLLCGQCNKALGLLEENPNRILGLAEYIINIKT